MDPVTALGVAAAVFQFVGLAITVTKRLQDYANAAAGDVPKPLRNISAQLPLITNSLSRMQNEAELSKYDAETRCVLHGVVVGCLRLVREVDEITLKITPRYGESLASKLKKVFNSLKADDRVAQVDRGLQTHIQVLVLHRVVDSKEVFVPAELENEYFGVKEKKVLDFIKRDAQIAQLDKLFYAVSRCQVEHPTFAVLQGKQEAGKSQLALEYCYQAYQNRQFRTVFWVDASSPILLKIGLESVACEIRRSRAGTKDEKLTFLSTFFKDRYQSWLLVLDNYRSKAFEKEPLKSILPDSGHGAILVTSRDEEAAALGPVIRVHKFLTSKEKDALRGKVSQAIRKRDIEFIQEAIEEGLDVNSPSTNAWSDKGPSFLSIASSMGFNEAVVLLLEHGARQVLDPGTTPAMGSAAHAGHVSTVETYLDYEDRKDQVFPASVYDAMFLYALENNQTDVLTLLLDRRPGLYNPQGRMTTMGFERAAGSSHTDVFRILVDRGKLPTSPQTRATIVTGAAKRRNVDLLKLIVVEGKVDVNTKDDSSQFPLYEAQSSTGYPDDDKVRLEMISVLLAAGADPNTPRPQDKRTPVHRAAQVGAVSVLELLINHGADLFAVDEDKHTALMFAARAKSTSCYPMLTKLDFNNDSKALADYYLEPLFWAAQKGDRDLVLAIIKHKPILNVVSADKGKTALIESINYGQTPVARMLLRAGADPTIATKDGSMALHRAAAEGLHLIVRELVRPGKNGIAIPVDTPDQKGETALTVAIRNQRKEVVEVLLKLGADRDAMNDYGETALDVAEEKKLDEIIKLLEEGWTEV